MSNQRVDFLILRSLAIHYKDCFLSKVDDKYMYFPCNLGYHRINSFANLDLKITEEVNLWVSNVSLLHSLPHA